MTIKKAQVPVLQFRADVTASESGGKKKATVKWSTGARVSRMDWFSGEMFFEELSMDASAVRMGRLQSGRAPFLAAHDGRELDSVLGVVESATLNPAEATVRFSDREDVQPIFQDVQSGILSNVSVGYKVYRYQDVTPPAMPGEPAPIKVYRAIDWEPVEISLVPVGADENAYVSGRSEASTHECELISSADSANEKQEETNMSKEQNQEQPAPAAPAAIRSEATVDADAIRKEAVKAERTRTVEITKTVRAVKLPDSFAEKLIAEGVSLDAARAQIIDELAKSDTQVEVRSHGPKVTAGGQDETVTRREGIENALMVRAGLEKELSGNGKRFAGLSLIEIGRKLTGMEYGSKTEVASRALSSSDFPLLLSNVANKQLMQAYSVLGRTFEPFVSRGTLSDYKPGKRYQVGDAPALLEIKEGSEYKIGKFGEKGESIVLADYGRKLKFTRQMMINDDLQAFQRVIQNFGSAAARLESKIVYTDILVGNPTMGDSVALFHADHGNLLSASDIDVTNLALAEKAIMEQKTLDSEDYLNLVAKFLIVGTAKKVKAQQVLASKTLPTKSSDVNPFEGAYQLIVDPRISGNKWFMACGKDSIAMIELAYLEGEAGPVIDSQESWDSDGMEIKCRHTVAGKALEWKGLVYNPGA